MERNIQVFEASVIKDSVGNVYPSGCTMYVSCHAEYVGDERIATGMSDTNCSVNIQLGDKLPLEGSAVENVLTAKMLDPVKGYIWVSKTSYDSNIGQCNACCEPLPVLATPVLTAEPGDAEVDLSWPAVPNATNYVLERDTDFAFGTPTEIYNGALLLFNDAPLVNGTPYYYRLTAQADPEVYADSEYGYATATPAP